MKVSFASVNFLTAIMLWGFVACNVKAQQTKGGEASTENITSKSLSDLKAVADEVLSLSDNIEIRQKIEPVFEVARQFVECSQDDQALKYFQIALQHAPWRLNEQLVCAKLLQKSGNSELAKQKAQTVLNEAETDSLILDASEILGEKREMRLSDSEPWPSTGFALALVPVGEVDGWLLQSLRQDLQATLDIPVVFRFSTQKLPEPTRDHVQLFANQFRPMLERNTNDPSFQLMWQKLKTRPRTLSNNEAVFEIVREAMLSITNKEGLKRFESELAVSRKLGSQWNADDLLELLRQVRGVSAQKQRGYLGIARFDLYANNNRYVFGTASAVINCGVMSYLRYTSAVVDLPPKQERLKQRALKQALSSAGFIFGVPRCTQPTCARAYANSLDEHDAKSVPLCKECKVGFDKAFGRLSN
ncbi:MAG: hypothetical protein HZA89_05300 [Verrucomicrobia bacterium]|nr:hypothetical protein [Verrucomicrobiota bacterium]